VSFNMPLIEPLRQASDRVLLRVVDTPGARTVHQFTGRDLLESQATARLQPIAEDSRIILLLLPHSPELFLLQIGLTLCGKAPAVLPWPTTQVDGAKYQRNLLHQLRHLPVHHLITLPGLAHNLQPYLDFSVSELELENGAQFETRFLERFSPEAYNFTSEPPCPPKSVVDGRLPEDALFLQFSGGTTATQKSVVVTNTLLVEQLSRLSEALDQRTSDGIVSWLPLYHDMGLIACLYFPLWAGIPSLHFAAADWLLRPELLFHYLQQYDASLCWLPNFAFSYMAQRKKTMEETYSLGHVRAWISCSEPVRNKSFRDFTEQFGDWGVLPSSLQSSYAMAENVFAVTQSFPGAHPRTVSPSLVRRARPPDTFEGSDDVYISSGRPLRGMSLRIIGTNSLPCSDLMAGEIQLHSPSLFQGYWDRGGFRREVFTEDGWYRTGDFGFTLDADLFVIGRITDIIIVAGQNIFPEDIEFITSQIAGVYPGRVAAFAVENEELGTQSIGIVAELSSDSDPAVVKEVEREIRSLIIASLGVAPRFVKVVPQRWIVKSTAGKISRRDTRNRFLEEQSARRLRQDEPGF
jgi:fatty-acyl-CoA synthase